MFQKEKEELKYVFKDLAIEIEHIGSTSIEGLSEKPVIDIAIAVEKLSDFKKVEESLKKEPYSIKLDSVSDEILIRKGSEENRTHFIHVMELNSKRYKDTIIFRDYMRNHKDSMEEYENLKIELAKKYHNDRKMYTLSKNNFIQDILKIAYKENNKIR